MKSNFTEEQWYRIFEICDQKEAIGSWQDVADMLNEEFNCKCDEATYRKPYKGFLLGMKINENILSDKQEMAKSFNNKQLKLMKTRQQISDMRVMVNESIRFDNRLQDFYDKMILEVKGLNNTKPLLSPVHNIKTKEKIGVLLLSDLHIGLDTKNRVNVFNTEVAKQRFSKLAVEVINAIKQQDIQKIVILNLGDIISNDIHTTLRLENRETVTEQLITAGEMIAELIHLVSKEVDVEYHSTFGNHDRITKDKKESRNVDNYLEIVDWHLKTRFIDNKSVNIVESKTKDGIIDINILGHDICGVHGDKDKPSNIASNLSQMLNKHFKLYVMGHKHSSGLTEIHKAYVVQNGAFSATDEFAYNGRWTAHASQTLLTITKEDVLENMKIIKL